MRAQLLVFVFLIACTPKKRADEPLPPIDPTRLSHEQHAQVPCTNCHRSGEKRPGISDHRPCDDPACHRKEFLSPPGNLCKVCHEKVTTVPIDAPLRKYPNEDLWQSLPPVFSHKRHMDAGKMEQAVGFHVACTDCHLRDGKRAVPDHAVCARCHAAEVGLTKAPAMEDCNGCHRAASQRPRKRVRLIRDDLKFSHERHFTDRRNQPIKCEACHVASAASNSYADHPAPKVEYCVSCHDDSDRTPITERMRVCETCHSEKNAGLVTLAPRSHLPASERPLDHTIAFRRDHAEIASRNAQRCATCHVQMSGNPAQACDECHQTMLPSDHRITWRELDHGPEAAAARNRCATCHVVEFCTACHSQRPRSHGLAGTFTKEHGRLARINVRSCLTCHVAEFQNLPGMTPIVSCADCHSVPNSVLERR